MTTAVTQLKVVTAMVQAQRPASIGELSTRTGLSYNSVKRALAELGANASDKYPALYTLPSAEEIAEQIAQHGTQIVASYRQPEGGQTWLDWYSRVLLPALTGTKITRDSNPAQWASTLSKLGELLLSMSKDLHENADNPDWFDNLGGIIKLEMK